MQGLVALLLAELTAVADWPPPLVFLGLAVGDDVTGLEQKLQIKFTCKGRKNSLMRESFDTYE